MTQRSSMFCVTVSGARLIKYVDSVSPESGPTSTDSPLGCMSESSSLEDFDSISLGLHIFAEICTVGWLTLVNPSWPYMM